MMLITCRYPFCWFDPGSVCLAGIDGSQSRPETIPVKAEVSLGMPHSATLGVRGRALNQPGVFLGDFKLKMPGPYTIKTKKAAFQLWVFYDILRLFSLLCWVTQAGDAGRMRIILGGVREFHDHAIPCLLQHERYKNVCISISRNCKRFCDVARARAEKVEIGQKWTKSTNLTFISWNGQKTKSS